MIWGMNMKKHKNMKKYLSLTIAGLISLNLAGPVYGAPTKEEQLAELEQQLLVLETKLKAEQGKTVIKKERQKNPKKNWDISADTRVKWESSEAKTAFLQRARLNLDHDINDKVSFHTRWALMEDNEFGLSKHFAYRINTNNSNHAYAYTVYPDLNGSDNGLVSEAYLKIKDVLGAQNAVIGRFSQTFGATGFWSDEDAFGGIDGVKLTYGNKAKINIGFANFGAALDYPDFGGSNAINARAENYYRIKPLEEAYFMNAELPVNRKVKLHAMVLKEKTGKDITRATEDAYIPYYDDKASNYDLHGIGITAKLHKNLTFVGDYITNTSNSSIYLSTGSTSVANAKNNYVRQEYPDQHAKYLSLRYKGAKWGDKGSFGMNFDYRDIDAATRSNFTANAYYGMNSMLFSPYASNSMTLVSDGIKGPVIGTQYMLSKNIKLDVMHSFNNTFSYYDYKYWKEGSKGYASSTLATKDASNYTSISLSTRF